MSINLSKPHGAELPFPTILTDAGRLQSKRSRQSNDCTVRALATVLAVPYDSAYDFLASKGRRSGRGFKLSSVVDGQRWATKTPFPARKGEPRMNLGTFVATHTEGRFIAKCAKHVIAIVDGVVFDEYPPRPDRCVYTAWAIDPSLGDIL